MKNKILIGCALFCIALLLRLPTISLHSLWFDETSTAFCIHQQSYSDMWKSVNTLEATPPMFFILEKAFIDGFHLKLNEFSLRFLPMMCGVLMCLLYFLLFQEISAKKTAFFAFFLIAFSNFHIFTSQDARSYSLFCLLALTTLFLTLKWWKKPDPTHSIVFFMAVMLTIQVHYYAVLWMAGLFMSVLVVKFRDPPIKKYLTLLAVASVFSFALLVPLFLTQVTYTINPIKHYLLAKWIPGIVYSPIKVLIGAYLFKINSLRQITSTDWLGIVPAIVFMAIAASYFLRRLRERQVSDSEKIITFSMIVAFCLHVMIGWKAPTIHPQYMEHYLLLLFGCIVVNFARNNYLQIGVFCALLTLNIIANVNFYNPSKMYIEPWKDIALTVDGAITKDGARSEAMLGTYTSCLPIAFYLKNKESPIFQIISPFEPDLTFTFAQQNVFGSTMYTNLFHYTYFPSKGQTSFMEIVNNNRRGLLITTHEGPTGSVADRLNEMYKEKIEFSALKIFDTNQGHISIIRWRVK